MSLVLRCTRVVLPLLVPALLGAQGATGVVMGRVTTRPDSGIAQPVRGALVSVMDGAIAATAGADGRWVLARVPAGPRTVRVRLLGYRTQERTVVVPAGDTLRVDFTLSRQAQFLAPLRTDARPADAEAFEVRPSVATVTMDAAAMEGVPSLGEPDVVRVVQLLPGVVARNDFNTGLNVRGGEADQNLILLDGHPIYNPFHLGGLFSTFMDATVGGIELLTGAFPARHGGRVSSVLDVRSAEVTREGIHGSADLSVLAASARLAGSTATGRATWSVAARRTYVDALAATFGDDPYPYYFYDYHGRATLALPGELRLAVTGYAGRDFLDVDLAELEGDSVPQSASSGEYAFDWGNQVLGATLTRDFGPRVTVEQRASLSRFAMHLDLGEGAFAQRGRTRDLRLAGSVVARGTAHDLSMGYDVATQRVAFAAGAPQAGLSDVDLVQRPTTGALWVEDLWRPSTRWLLQGGLRAEALSTRDWMALSPRASVKFFATPRLALVAAAGRATQTMHSLASDGPLRFFDVWLSSDAHIPVTTAWHWVAGLERRMGDAASVRAEGWTKRYDRVLEPNLSDDPARRGDEFLPAAGESYGVDLFARWRRPSGNGGWLSYTYGVSTRSRDGVRWSPAHDRRHDLDVVGMWTVRRYRLGARFGWASGTPYTPITGEIARRVWDPSRERWGTGDPRNYVEPLGGVRNGARFPATHRLDLDVSREFAVRGATIAPYVSLVNAYNARNVFVYLYDYSTLFPNRRALGQFPILPSVGVRVAF